MRLINLASIILLLFFLNSCEKLKEIISTPTEQKKIISESVIQPITPKLSSLGYTDKIITLRGLDFDTPNQTEALKKLCISERVGKPTPSEFFCVVSKSGEIHFEGFRFGNLYRNVYTNMFFIKVETGTEGSLTYFRMIHEKEAIIELAGLLSETYGEADVKQEEIVNDYGAKFDKKTFTWIDNRGTKMTVKSIDSDVDNGSITIESKSRVAKNVEAEIEARKKALNSL